MKIMFLIVGNDEKNFAKHTCGSSVVSMTSPVKSDLFRIFRDDRFHDDQNSLVKESDILKIIKKDSIKDIPVAIFRKFTTTLAEMPSLASVTTEQLITTYIKCGLALKCFCISSILLSSIVRASL